MANENTGATISKSLNLGVVGRPSSPFTEVAKHLATMNSRKAQIASETKDERIERIKCERSLVHGKGKKKKRKHKNK